MANVYTVYPGQLLHINLIISPRWSELSSTIIAANTKDDDCSILDNYQLSQTHTNNGCNRYSYTIWPNSEFITECLNIHRIKQNTRNVLCTNETLSHGIYTAKW